MLILSLDEAKSCVSGDLNMLKRNAIFTPLNVFE